MLTSQTSNFKLTDYQLPELKRQTLDFDFDAKGRNSSYRRSIDSNSVNNISNNISGNLYINYNLYINKTNKQIETHGLLELVSSFENQKRDDTLYNKRSNIQPKVSYELITRHYIKENRFIETDLYFNLSNAFRNGIRYIPYYDSRNYNATVFTPIKIGLGRIERVEDVRHAIYIIDALRKAGKVNQELTDEEFLEFATLISEVKNERVFDARLKRIYELEIVDSFLLKNSFIKESDIEYFSTLTDMWEYGHGQERLNGTRLSAAIYPGYNFYSSFKKHNIDSTSEYSTSSFAIYGGLEFVYARPINLKFQSNIYLDAYFGYLNGQFNDRSETLQDFNIPNLDASIRHELAYYPNTRTNINFSYSGNIVKLFKDTRSDNIHGDEGLAVYANTSLFINYYISPKLSLNILGSFMYRFLNTENYNSLYAFNPLYTSRISNNLEINDNNNNLTTGIDENLNSNFRIGLTYLLY